MADRVLVGRTRSLSRLSAALAATSAVVQGVPAAALASPEGSFLAGNVGDRASALWRLPPQEGGVVFFFAEVYQGVNSAGQGGRAVVGVGTCTRTTDEEICQAIGFGHELAPGEFKVEPLLDMAVLDYHDGRARQHVRWEATLDDPPSAKPGYRAGRRGGAAEAKVFRHPKVTADLDFPYVQDGHVTLGADLKGQGDLARGSTFGAGVPLAAFGFEATTSVDREGRYHIRLNRSL